MQITNYFGVLSPEWEIPGNNTKEGIEKLQDLDGRAKCYEILFSAYDMAFEIMNPQKVWLPARYLHMKTYARKRRAT